MNKLDNHLQIHHLPQGEEADPEIRRRAARTVASAAHDADDCAELLAMLGLHPTEGKQVTA